MSIFLGLVLGTAFGFLLHRAGASSADKIINMLRWKDLDIFRFLMLGIAVSMVGIALFDIFGLAHTSIKATYVPGLILGGLIFGVGFAVSGYCPGTSLVALGEGKKDAVFTVLGGLVGALVYSLIYVACKPLLNDTLNFGKITLPDILGLPALLVAVLLGGLITLIVVKAKPCDGEFSCPLKKK